MEVSLIKILYTLLDFIKQDVFIGFGVYSLLLFFIRRMRKDETILKSFDKDAVHICILGGLIFFPILLLATWLEYQNLENHMELLAFRRRIFGEYWFGFWLQPILWLTLSQLLRLDIFKRKLLLRLILSFTAIFTFEKIVLVITYFHNDFLPKSFSFAYFDWVEMCFGFLLNGLLFVLAASIAYSCGETIFNCSKKSK